MAGITLKMSFVVKKQRIITKYKEVFRHSKQILILKDDVWIKVHL